ncbi:hypothetical protein HHI36_000377 [Cryptolaemus montrouzieri]|uniref:Uncharacterized protein n=1 Tax=Cryptolaemus montrouzieri TaxID=559131 RepID=A0ABD2P5G8_9CUCU
MQCEFPKSNENPKSKANWFSSLFFIYTFDIFWKGYTNGWNDENIYNPLDSNKSDILGKRFEMRWKKQIIECENKNIKPSINRMIFEIFWRDIVFDGLLVLLYQMLKLPEPFLLGYFLSYFSQNSEISKEVALFILFSLISMNGIRTVLFAHMKLSCQETALKIRASCGGLIQAKVLKLSKSSSQDKAAKNILNLISNDLNRFDIYSYFVHYIWVTPVCLLSILYMLYCDAGIPGLVGIIWFIMTMFLQSYVAKVAGLYRTKIGKKTDKRLKIMEELLTGIQVIKMYAWERTFSKFIESCRNSELKTIKKATYFKAILPSLLMFINTTAIFVGILTMILMAEPLSVAKVFKMIVYYSFFSVMISFCYPTSVTKNVELYNVLKRIEKFMTTEEIKEENMYTFDPDSSEHEIKLENICARWSGTKNNDFEEKDNIRQEKSALMLGSEENAEQDEVLKKVNLKVKDNDFLGVVGPVGSGKSSLLCTILGETHITSGQATIRGTISYASQEPWIFSGTIRENIIFNQTFDKSRYFEVTRVCGLEKDLQLFPLADSTLVGERGSCLSGGQKARINLARAVYRDADIYLFDDPLSPLDANVSKYLVDECFNKFLVGKCRVLVTHHTKHLENCSHIIALNSGLVEFNGLSPEFRRSIEYNFEPIGNLHSDMKNEEEPMEEESAGIKMTIQKPDSPIENAGAKMSPVSQSKKSYLIEYFRRGCGITHALLAAVLFVICQIIDSCFFLFVGYWSHSMELNKDQSEEVKSGSFILGGLILALGTFSLLKGIFYAQMATKISKTLHEQMLEKTIGGEMKFFYRTTSGQIISRFSKDLGVVDELLPRILLLTTNYCIGLSARLLIVTYMNPYTVALILICLFLIPFLVKRFQNTARNLGRLEASLMGPILTHISATIEGLTTIRSSEAENFMIRQFDARQDRLLSSWYMFCCVLNAFSLFIDLMSFVFISAVMISCFLMRDVIGLNGGEIGLSITQAMGLAAFLQFGVVQYIETNNSIVAVERIIDYTEIPQEQNKNRTQIQKNWPQFGGIIFENVVVKYEENASVILKDLSFFIRPTEKIGIVGRTGAGKSSIIATLFQMTLVTGSIKIDGIEISTIPIETLRSSISIIPQDPVLFSGTLRYNLDPFDEFDDAQLYQVLREVDYGKTTSGIYNLHELIGNRGSNLSVGQKQLINLARAILRKNKILVLDEATSNIDTLTDRLIQATVRRMFADCTVLTIAHRLSTIMDSDRIMVLDAGEIVQFDTPENLLQNKKGIFYDMLNQKSVNSS